MSRREMMIGALMGGGGGGGSAQTKSVTPSAQAQTVTPDSGYDYLEKVNVAAIPYTETDNEAGGKTLTIG